MCHRDQLSTPSPQPISYSYWCLHYHHFEVGTYNRINRNPLFDDLRPWKIPNLNQDSGTCPLIGQIRANTGLKQPDFNARGVGFLCDIPSWRDTPLSSNLTDIRDKPLRGIAPNKISALSRIGAAPKARITIGGGIPLGELVIGPSVVEPPQTGDRHRHHGKAHPYFTAP